MKYRRRLGELVRAWEWKGDVSMLQELAESNQGFIYALDRGIPTRPRVICRNGLPFMLDTVGQFIVRNENGWWSVMDACAFHRQYKKERGGT